MKKLGWLGMAVTAAVLVSMVAMSGCSAVPKGASKQVTVNSTTLKATGAGIVKADAAKAIYQIKCTVCGFVSESVTIDTPSKDKPYEVEWVCPKCGHKQKVTVTALVAAAGG